VVVAVDDGPVPLKVGCRSLRYRIAVNKPLIVAVNVGLARH